MRVARVVSISIAVITLAGGSAMLTRLWQGAQPQVDGTLTVPPDASPSGGAYRAPDAPATRGPAASAVGTSARVASPEATGSGEPDRVGYTALPAAGATDPARENRSGVPGGEESAAPSVHPLAGAAAGAVLIGGPAATGAEPAATLATAAAPAPHRDTRVAKEFSLTPDGAPAVSVAAQDTRADAAAAPEANPRSAGAPPRTAAAAPSVATVEARHPASHGVQLPPPTEIVKGRDEAQLHRERRAWIESIHRAPPGTDWRAIEAQNWNAHLERRNEGRRERLGASQQPPDPLPWIEVGSVNLGGRTHQTIFHAASNKLYLGSNLGGLWSGDFNPASPDPSRMNWQPLSDGVYGSAFQVVVLDGPPSTLLKSHAQAYSSQLHRSIDGGTTWRDTSGITGRIRRLIALRNAEETVFAITDSPNQWACGSGVVTSTSLLRSRDRGATFQLVRDLGTSRADVWTSRVALGPLYVLTDNRLEISTDLGTTWSTVGTLPWTGPSRVALTASEAGGPTFYAVIDKNDCSGGRRLFRSNGGVTWTQVGTVSDFWGDLVSLSASTTHPDLLLYGGVEAWRSTNGGATFTRVNAWGDYYGNPAQKLHADIPSIDFVPLASGGELLLVGTDGGTYYSLDSGASFRNISLDGLRVSQYYSTLSDVNDPRQIQAGSQDQGYQKGEAGQGASFEQLISGDYGHLTSSNGTLGLVYSAYPGFILVAERSGTTTTLYGGGGNFVFPSESHHWLPNLVADPLNANAVYLCARHLYRYARSGNTWTPTQLAKDFDNGNGDYASALAIAPTDPNRRYVATDRGRVWYSINAGADWSLSTFSGGIYPQYLTGMAVLVDPTDPLNVYLGGSGYGNPSVYRSTDGGLTFAPFNVGLPSTLVFDLAADPLGGGDVYAATESGPYRYSSALGSWQSLLGDRAPMTTYWSVERAHDRVRFGTYGRGIWDYVPPVPSCEYSITPTLAVFGGAGGASTLNVTAGVSCPWSVSRLGSWISLTGVTKGTGNGTITYTVASNPSAVGRTGHVTVRDQVLTVAQSMPTVSIGDVTEDEGSGTRSMVFGVSLSAASSAIVSVDYATADGTATVGSDYVAASGTLTFAPGTTTQQVTVTVIGETASEASETFFVNLSGATNATLGDGQGVGTLVNDDNSLSVEKLGTGSGRVTSSPSGIDCGAACSSGFSEGTEVVLTAAARRGSVFDGWSGPPGTCSGLSTTCTVTLASDQAVTATFRLVGGFHTVAPCRAFDSRDPSLGGPASLLAGTDTLLTLVGKCQVSASAKAVSLNVTVTSPTEPGYLSLYPAGAERPLVSVINFAAEQTRANNAVLSLGDAGAIAVFVGLPAGSVHAIVDVNGYFAE